MQQHGCILKWCWVKEARQKRIYTVWFDLYNFSKKKADSEW